jgi:hypothetical protein
MRGRLGSDISRASPHTFTRYSLTGLALGLVADSLPVDSLHPGGRCLDKSAFRTASDRLCLPVDAGRERWSLIPGPDRSEHQNEEKEFMEKSKTVSGAFGRQKTVESGLVQTVCSSVSLSAQDRRLWILRSVKLCYGVVGGCQLSHSKGVRQRK